MVPDYYERLGVPPKASKETIKKAFRRLALRYHPDKCSLSNAHTIFISINEAYLILSDDEARIRYDREYVIYYGYNFTDVNAEIKSKPDQFDNENRFKDETLNHWAKNAREQAEEYDKMSYSEFYQLLKGIAV